MSQEFKKCLERGKIKTFSPGPALAKKELRLAQEDLAISESSAAENNFRWSITQSYYSINKIALLMQGCFSKYLCLKERFWKKI